MTYASQSNRGTRRHHLPYEQLPRQAQEVPPSEVVGQEGLAQEASGRREGGSEGAEGSLGQGRLVIYFRCVQSDLNDWYDFVIDRECELRVSIYAGC